MSTRSMGRLQVLPDRMKLTSLRSQPAACDRCTKRMSDLCEREVSVHHGALLLLTRFAAITSLPSMHT